MPTILTAARPSCSRGPRELRGCRCVGEGKAAAVARDRSWHKLLTLGCLLVQGFEAFEVKMKAAGLSEAAIRAFKCNYEQLVAGVTGMVGFCPAFQL